MIPAQLLIVSSLLLGSIPSGAPLTAPNSHLWVVNEILSNADGSIQFIEMLECCGSSIETSLAGKTMYSDATGHQYTFPTNLTGDTAHRYLLLGTVAFAALPGAPAPDFIIPPGFFSTSGDTIRWFVYPNATLSFGPGALPVNGVDSLRRDGTTGTNTPTNFAGQSGSIAAIVLVPAWSAGKLVALIALVLLTGSFLLVRRRAG